MRILLRRFKWLIFLASLGLLTGTTMAQSTTISVTVTDLGGQVWKNGTISYVFQPNPSFSGTYQWNGSALPTQYLTPQIVLLNSSGFGSFTVPTSSLITPSGSTWKYVVCPNATSPCTVINLASVGSTQDISSQVTAATPVISAQAGPMPLAYTDAEITITPNQGGIYFNVTSFLPKYFDGANWQFYGGGGGGGVTLINGVGGAFTFTGSGVSCVTTTCTFTGGSGGVTSFNTRTGAVVLLNTDIETLLAASPFNITTTNSSGNAGHGNSILIGNTSTGGVFNTNRNWVVDPSSNNNFEGLAPGGAVTISLIPGTGAASFASGGFIVNTAGGWSASSQGSMGVNKIIGLANGTSASDAAAFGQIPTALPPNGVAGGILSGTYPNPGFATAAANTILGNPTGSSAIPIFTTNPIVTSITVGTTIFSASGLDTASNNFTLTVLNSTLELGATGNNTIVDVGVSNTLQVGGHLTLTFVSGCLEADATTHIVSGTGSPCGSGSGTVTSIATTGPITGGTITSTGTIACATCVTSAASLTGNQLVLGANSQGIKVLPGFTTDGAGTITLGVSGTTAGGLQLVNNTSGGITLITPSTGALGSSLATFPINTGTIAEINLAQTWSTLQTFSAGINLSGTTSPLQFSGSAGTSGNCAISGGAGVTPTWGACGSGFSNPMTTLGDIIYGGASGVATRLAGQTTAATYILSETATGSAVAPVWLNLASTAKPIGGTTGTFSGAITATNGTFSSSVSAVGTSGFAMGSSGAEGDPISLINNGSGNNSAVAMLLTLTNASFSNYTAGKISAIQLVNTAGSETDSLNFYARTTGTTALVFSISSNLGSIAGLQATGTKFTTSGCSVSSTTGGGTAGRFILGANTCSVVITMNGATGLTASNGWSCYANDRTSTTVFDIQQTADTTTTATFAIPATAGATDVISFGCIAY